MHDDLTKIKTEVHGDIIYSEDFTKILINEFLLIYMACLGLFVSSRLLWFYDESLLVAFFLRKHGHAIQHVYLTGLVRREFYCCNKNRYQLKVQ